MSNPSRLQGSPVPLPYAQLIDILIPLARSGNRPQRVRRAADELIAALVAEHNEPPCAAK